eukprot:1183844-Rhodomonas_salina.1
MFWFSPWRLCAGNGGTSGTQIEKLRVRDHRVGRRLVAHREKQGRDRDLRTPALQGVRRAGEGSRELEPREVAT